jgi:hypothetical protein
MTTRRWMIVIAVVALLMTGAFEVKRALRRASAYSQLAATHAMFRAFSLAEADLYRGNHFIRLEARERALARHQGALAAKYERAARYPWLPVEPDPPEPQ